MGKITTKLYLVKDMFGNESYAMCKETCDTIEIQGLYNKDSEQFNFECEAYHLAKACEDDGLELRVVDVEVAKSFDSLWYKDGK